jgi:putative acetyltransferase
MIAIRSYRVSDCQVLADVFKRAVRETAAHDYSLAQVLAWAPDERDMIKFAARLVAKPTFVAEIEGRIAGFTDLDDRGHIDMMFVDPDFQRKGVGSALLDFVIARARDGGMSRLFSDVSITARPLFERSGFTILAAQTVEKNGESFRNYRMEKLL